MQNFWKDLKKPFTVLAPMEDVTDVAFRRMVRETGRPDVFFTEFTNVDGMNSPGREKVIVRLLKDEDERPVVAQVWGRDPENYFKAAKDIAEMGFDGIDINMGCPVRKIVRHAVCSRLIEHPELAKEIIKAVKEGAGDKIPVSVKTRCGFKDWRTEEWISFILDQDIEALTVHGRIAREMSHFPARWEEIGKAVKLRDEMKKDTIIVGNGDVESLDHVKELHEKYGVDGCMIGRGIFKDPFVFNPNKSINDLSVDEKLNLVLRHTELFEQQWANTKNFSILRRFYKIYVNGFDGASDLRVKLMETKNIEEVRNIVKEYRESL